MEKYIKEINENRNNKEILLEDLIWLVRFDEWIETYTCGGVINNENKTLNQFYNFLKELIVKYGLDFELNNEKYIIDRIYGNGINAEKVAYYYFEEFLKQSLLKL